MRFTILHLSDLHISSKEDAGQRNVRQKLLEDAVNMTQKENTPVDAIVVSGDVVDRGGSVDAYQMATRYLKQLSTGLGVTTERVMVVPGNHDIPRRLIDKSVLTALTVETLADCRETTDHWEAMKPRFAQFDSFRDQMEITDPSGLFGSEIRSLSGPHGGTVRFLLLNSSWSTLGDSDFGRLRIGKWQLEDLLRQSSALAPADLTLALVHHPLNWLEDSERSLILDYFRDNRLLAVDAILHGHIHTGSIESYISPDGSVLSLVSGVGYPDIGERDRGQPKLSNCRYALYTFDVEARTVDLRLRVSGDEGSFAADTLLYKRGKETGRFTIPYGHFQSIADDPLVLSNVRHVQVDPPPVISDWVGRTRELETLLDPRVRVAAITGIGGQGKTSLASEFLHRYGPNQNSSFELTVWADCRELPHSLHLKVMEILEALTDGKESVDLYKHEQIQDTAKRFLSHLRRVPTLVVLDNIDAYVRADTESPTDELQPFFEAMLRSDHKSLVILTCRPSLNDSASSFKHISIGGFTLDEGIEFFKMRLGELTGPNAEEFGRRLVNLTLGHPWWLGLIAGQVSSNHDTLQACAERLGHGHDDDGRSRRAAYFQSIWSVLNRRSQTILRHLVEAPRPLTDLEISRAITDFGPVKMAQEIRRLVRLSLIDPHHGRQGNDTSDSTFQIHPLVREYVYNSYRRDAQRPFVTKILYVFLPRWLVDSLRTKQSSTNESAYLAGSLTDLADSIDTCLNSRNEEWALELLEKFGDRLYNGGFHRRFQSVSARTLDLVDWKESKLIGRSRGQKFLGAVVEQLNQSGNPRSRHYLNRFEALVEPNTIPHLMYLSLAAHTSWQEGRPREALNLLGQYDELSDRLDSRENLFAPAYTRALALRDSGKFEEALKLFADMSEKRKGQNADASDLGNSARCLIKLKRHEEAEDLLCDCLAKLLKDSTLGSRTNCGYAYLWIAEALVAQGYTPEAKLFVGLARHTWNEYAPGLLRKASTGERLVGWTISDEGRFQVSDALALQRTFLDRGAWAKHKRATRVRLVSGQPSQSSPD